MDFNIRHYERLQPLERYLGTVHRSQYKRATTRMEDNTVQDVLTELGYPKTDLTCAKCVYNMYSQAAKLYYKFAEDLNQTTIPTTYKTAVKKYGKKKG